MQINSEQTQSLCHDLCMNVNDEMGHVLKMTFEEVSGEGILHLFVSVSEKT